MSTLSLADKKLTEFNENLSNGFISIDSSSYENISCPRKAFLSWILRIVPAGGRSPLVFGHMLHSLLEWTLLEGGVKNIPRETYFEKVREIISKEGARLNECFDDKRNTDTFLNTCSAYYFNNLAKGDRIIPITLHGEKLVEKSFSLPLGVITIKGKSITVLWEGKIDCIGTDANTNRPCIWDHKTTSLMGPKFLDDKMRGPQFHGYLWAGNQIVKPLGFSIEEVGLNVIASKKTGVEFEIMKFKRPLPLVEEWRGSTLRKLETLMNSIIDDVQMGDIPLGDFAHCCPKFGKCDFYQVCEAPVSARRSYLDEPSMYQVSNWTALGEEG